MNWKNYVFFTGLGFYLFLLVIAEVVLNDFEIYVDVPMYVHLLVACALLIVPIVITWTNIQRKKYGCEDFGPFACFKQPEKEIFTKEWNRAAYPQIPSKYLSNTPEDLIIGKQGSKFIRIPIWRDGLNCLMFGNVGSFKTVTLISWLLANLYLPTSGLKWNWAVIDIKGEIYKKILKLPGGHYRAIDHSKVKVIEPSNKASYGWDPFYILKTPNVTETDIIKLADDVAAMLIEDSGDSNPYFSLNAKKILSGLVYHYAQKGYEFIPLMQLIARSNVAELIAKTVEEAEEEIEGVTLDKLQGFVGKDTESINDVISTMLTNFVIFSYPEVIWCLQLNPHKASPMDLNDGETCIDLAIEQSMLSTYGVLMKIITMGMLFHAERYFKDEDERNTLIIIDEASRVGALSSKGSFDVAGAQATMRSRHCGIIQIFQTLDQIEKLYGSEVSKILISLSEARIFLTGDGLPSATEMVASMAGEYRTARRSYDKKGIAGTAADTSYNDEYRKIVNGEAMLNLRQRREFIGILYGVYIRAKKYVYFECPILGPIYRDIESYNEHERDVKKEKEKLIKKNIKESGGN